MHGPAVFLTLDSDRGRVATFFHQPPEEDWHIGYIAFRECRRVLAFMLSAFMN